jgi:hypothetical protein
MQSEAGAAGALHGSLQAGRFDDVPITASQGMMILLIQHVQGN